MPPGPANRKRVVFGYIIPKGVRNLIVPVDQPLGRFQVLIEDPAVEMLGGPLSAEGPEFMEDVRFMRFDATDVPGGADASFRLSGRSMSLSVLLWIILGLSAFAMAAVFTVWARRPRGAAGHASDIDTLAAQIAALDERFAAKGASPSDTERVLYEQERNLLKTELTGALARRDIKS